MNSNRALVLGAVAELAASKPNHQRIALYRAVADFAGCPKDARRFLKLADEIEANEKRCHELPLFFSTPANNGDSR